VLYAEVIESFLVQRERSNKRVLFAIPIVFFLLNVAQDFQKSARKGFLTFLGTGRWYFPNFEIWRVGVGYFEML
jgi:hypothetical protein